MSRCGSQGEYCFVRELVSEVQEGAQRLYSWGTHGRQNDSGFVCLFRLQSVFGLCFSSVLSCTCITIIVVGQVSFCFLKSDDSNGNKIAATAPCQKAPTCLAPHGC